MYHVQSVGSYPQHYPRRQATVDAWSRVDFKVVGLYDHGDDAYPFCTLHLGFEVAER